MSRLRGPAIRTHIRALGGVASLVKPVAGKPLEFRTSGQEKVITLVPLHRLMDERYVVYWRLDPSEGAASGGIPPSR